MARVSLHGVVKAYGGLQVLHGIDLAIEDGEFVVFVGPSGCGKSTLLRAIAGLETISGGEIRIGDRPVTDLAPRLRDVAMVFQDYALYPHLSVYENMAFGLRLRKEGAAAIQERVAEAARILQIEHLLERKPKALSGGQRQRVAMGRAIVRQPSAFLFDEPLSNLDALLRSEMRVEIKKLHQQLKSTIIYVTHDQVEAMTLADRIVVLKGGRVQQVGTPDQIYNHPTNQFVAGFTGSPPMNFVQGRIARQVGHPAGGSIALAIEGGPAIPLPDRRRDLLAPLVGRAMVLGVRPEHIQVAGAAADGAQPGDLATLNVPVGLVEPLGSDTLAFLRLGPREIIGRFPPDAAPAAGGTASIQLNLARFHLFDAETGQAQH